MPPPTADIIPFPAPDLGCRIHAMANTMLDAESLFGFCDVGILRGQGFSNDEIISLSKQASDLAALIKNQRGVA